ncbi:MAG TPA: hypothetical protein VNB24_09485 [Acidimicrobiales bacterium]|nr:hypothetical protein [Acidimicrobiales bacterium]
MSRRIEIELTSNREDGSWTWRAAGAKQPKGTLDGSILQKDAKVGDVMRAEVEVEIDGMRVTSVMPPKSSSAKPELLPVIGSASPPKGGVTSQLTGGEKRGGRRGFDGGFGGDRDRGPGGGGGGKGMGTHGSPPRPERGRGARPEGGGGRGGPARSGGPGRGPRPDGAPRTERPPRAARPPRPAPEPPAPKPKPKRLVAARTHRDALLTSLNDAERRIAEQLLKGGLNEVRQSIEAQAKQSKAEGKDAFDAAPLLTLADDLLPRVATAEWRDLAEAAVASAKEIALRDLRSVVTKSDTAANDDETRELAAQLREALTQRLDAMKETWVNEVVSSIESGRLVRALRIAGQPPEPGTKLAPELLSRLAEAAANALNADTMADRWGVVVDAVASSPVRRLVTPLAPPAEVTEALTGAVTKIAAKVPAIAGALGIEVPPEAPKRAPARPRPTADPGRPPRTPRAPRASAAPAVPMGAMPKPKVPPPPPRPIPAPPAAPQPASAPTEDDIAGRTGDELVAGVPSSLDETEDVARPTHDDIAGPDGDALVPARESEPDAGALSTDPVVVGVADVHDSVGVDPQPGENEGEILGTPEVVAEQGDVGTPPETS